jgi:hypothetical protein
VAAPVEQREILTGGEAALAAISGELNFTVLALPCWKLK